MSFKFHNNSLKFNNFLGSFFHVFTVLCMLVFFFQLVFILIFNLFWDAWFWYNLLVVCFFSNCLFKWILALFLSHLHAFINFLYVWFVFLKTFIQARTRSFKEVVMWFVFFDFCKVARCKSVAKWIYSSCFRALIRSYWYSWRF